MAVPAAVSTQLLHGPSHKVVLPHPLVSEQADLAVVLVVGSTLPPHVPLHMVARSQDSLVWKQVQVVRAERLVVLP